MLRLMIESHKNMTMSFKIDVWESQEHDYEC